ncbi:MAG: glutathione synthase [Candidatus Omnitrophota bacterium]
MKIGFLVNDILLEKEGYTTTMLAWKAFLRGHDIRYIAVQDFTCGSAGDVRVLTRSFDYVRGRAGSQQEFFQHFYYGRAHEEVLNIDELDALFLRNDPAIDARSRPWAQYIGISFGRVAASRGVLVINNPDGLAAALNKLYFLSFPAEIQPRTMVSYAHDEIKAFVKSLRGQAVLKPLQGSQGSNVFHVHPHNLDNLNQIISAISRDGYIMAQEYLPESQEGDTRLFVVEGEILTCDGKRAAVHRRTPRQDFRSNLSIGAHSEKAYVTDGMLQVVERIREKLRADGMFFVCVDLIGEKLIEINIFSPGGLMGAEKQDQADYGGALLTALEKKIQTHQAK